MWYILPDRMRKATTASVTPEMHLARGHPLTVLFLHCMPSARHIMYSQQLVCKRRRLDSAPPRTPPREPPQHTSIEDIRSVRERAVHEARAQTASSAPLIKRRLF